jgi:mRNA interferase RelE/StbE
MKVIASRNFEKNLKACPLDIQQKAKLVYENLLACKKLSEIASLEKLAGHKTYFRVRIGTYRLGFELQEDCVELLAIMHRKEIYRFFP